MVVQVKLIMKLIVFLIFFFGCLQVWSQNTGMPVGQKRLGGPAWYVCVCV